MGRDSFSVLSDMRVLMESIEADGALWENGNKAAAARVRKATLVLAKLGKEFRELSVAEAKKN